MSVVEQAPISDARASIHGRLWAADETDPDCKVLTSDERRALLTWVQEWVSGFAPIGEWIECERVEKSAWLADELGLSEADGRALFDAALSGLTLEQAREHASRFEAWLKYSTTSREVRPWSPGMPTLSPPERERLFTWVKARMAAVDSDSLSRRDDMVMAVATDLGLLHPSGLPLSIARDLCDLAVPS